MKHYPAMARRFPELAKLELYEASHGVTSANEVRTEAYKSFYNKLPDEERRLADSSIKELRTIERLGRGGARELLVALAQVMEWADWPERMSGGRKTHV